jgi:predicted Zn-dependent protease
MEGSNSVAEDDTKPIDACAICTRKLYAALKFDAV